MGNGQLWKEWKKEYSRNRDKSKNPRQERDWSVQRTEMKLVAMELSMTDLDGMMPLWDRKGSQTYLDKES